MAFNKREHAFAIVALLCLLALVGNRFVATPLWGLWKTRSARIAELEKSIANGETLLDREESLNQRWQDMRANSLPAEKSVAENTVVEAVNNWARESNLNITSLKPRWTNSKEQDEIFSKIEFRVAATGNLRAIAEFLYAIESDSMALKIENADIVSRDTRSGSLLLDVQFTGLMLTEDKQ